MATEEAINVLLIEDNPADVRLVKEVLRGAPSDRFNIISASTLAQGLKRLAADHVDVVLLDLGLPDSQGFDTFRAVNDSARNLPIIVLTVSTDEEIGLKAIRAGAQRFFSKDALTPDGAYGEIVPQMIRHSIEQKQMEAELQQRNEQVRRLNMELASTTQELRTINRELELRMNGRTEELGIANEELLREIGERVTAENDVEARAHNTAALNAIIHVLNEAPDLPTLYERALTTTAHQLGFDSGVVGTVTDSERVTMQYAYNLPPETVDAFNRLHLDSNPLMRAIYREQKPLVLDETSPVLESYRFGQHGAVVAIPYTSEGVTNGVIALYATDRRSFTPADRELFQMIGLEFGTAVARIRAKARVEEHARWQSILTHVITAGNKASNLTTACANMLGTALDLLPLYYGCIFLLDQRTADAVTLQSAHGYTAKQLEWAQRIPLTQRLAARVMAGTPLFFDDYQAAGSPDAQSMNSEVQSMTFIPLMTGDTVLGFYNLGSRGAQHHFTDDEQQLLIAIGREAGTVIARLQAEEIAKEHARRTAILNDIIHVLNEAADLHTAFDQAFALMVERLGFNRGVIITETPSGRVRVQHAYNYPPELIEAVNRLAIDDNQITRTIYREGQLYLVSELPSDTQSAQHGIHGATVGIPFYAEGKVVGHIALHAEHAKSFTAEDRQLFTAIGQEFDTAMARLRAKESLKESEARYRHLVERNYDGVIIHVDGIIRFANDAAARIMKAPSPGELIGLNALDIATPAYREMLAQRVQEIYRTHESSELAEVQITACDGTIVDIEMSGTLVTYDGKPAVYIMARDITERKQMEAQLKQYADHLEDLVEERTAQLKDSERLAGIGQTAAMIGHDLRNPLQALQFSLELERKYVEAALKTARADPTVEKTVEKAVRLYVDMEQQIRYMDKIVSDLQDYARPLQLECEEISAASLIGDTLSLLTVPESISVRVDVHTAVSVTIDPHFMQRALSNLVMNAVQAMPTGGELMIGATTDDHAVLITIHDTGDGVPENMKDTLFSPLTTGKAKGTGLGLAVVKRIIEAHNGTITFESEEGKGTTFTVTLPQTAK